MNDYDVIVIGHGGPVGECMEKEHGESEVYKLEHSEAPIQGVGRMEDNTLFKWAQKDRTRGRPTEADRTIK